jgi:SAM-dependent MidA family methyltransferase
LGSDFAALLAPQIAQWLLRAEPGPVALIEAGPGEGDLAADLADALVAGWPELAVRLELVLIEPNAGMAARQRQRLSGCPLPVRWCSFAELAAAPAQGVVLAHEVLDALPVERVIWDGALWRRQLVVLDEAAAAGHSLGLSPGEPLDSQVDAALWNQLQLRGLSASHQLPAGWITELHTAVAPWLAAAGAALARGVVLVVDYALDNRRYNAAIRAEGTLIAYRQQRASGDLLQDPGHWDLTAHLCLEPLEADARASGWQPLGQRRQGEALLALGLAQRLHGLQSSRPDQLAAALASREALLRLVDPGGLGAFQWIAFGRPGDHPVTDSLFLADPPDQGGCG